MNAEQLKASLLKANQAKYDGYNKGGEGGSSKHNLPYFKLKDNSNRQPEGFYSANVRYLPVPKTNGYAVRLMHPFIGWPNNTDKERPISIVCNKYFNLNKECMICDLYDLVRNEDQIDPALAATIMKFPVWNGSTRVVQDTSIVSVLKQLRSERQMTIFILQKEKMMLGPQIWNIQKETLIKKIEEFLKQGEAFLAHPETGQNLFVKFDGKQSGSDMYTMYPTGPFPVTVGTYAGLPDPESIAPRSSKPEFIQKKISEMFPGIKFS